MIKRIIYIGENNDIKSYKLTASKGKVLKRIKDGQIFGKELILGNIWFLDGKKLTEPIFEAPTDYEEIEEIEDTESISLMTEEE